jgi:hypothetical protein
MDLIPNIVEVAELLAAVTFFEMKVLSFGRSAAAP